MDDLLAWVAVARQGDRQAGEQAWTVCEGLMGADDPILAALGRGLQRLLAGEQPALVLAGIPDPELRQYALDFFAVQLAP